MSRRQPTLANLTGSWKPPRNNCGSASPAGSSTTQPRAIPTAGSRPGRRLRRSRTTGSARSAARGSATSVHTTADLDARRRQRFAPARIDLEPRHEAVAEAPEMPYGGVHLDAAGGSRAGPAAAHDQPAVLELAVGLGLEAYGVEALLKLGPGAPHPLVPVELAGGADDLGCLAHRGLRMDDAHVELAIVEGAVDVPHELDPLVHDGQYHRRTRRLP